MQTGTAAPRAFLVMATTGRALTNRTLGSCKQLQPDVSTDGPSRNPCSPDGHIIHTVPCRKYCLKNSRNPKQNFFIVTQESDIAHVRLLYSPVTDQ
jgi:hypothetical protein